MVALNQDNNNIFAIVESTFFRLQDSNTTVGVKNLLRWDSNCRPLVYKAGVFFIKCASIRMDDFALLVAMNSVPCNMQFCSLLPMILVNLKSESSLCLIKMKPNF